MDQYSFIANAEASYIESMYKDYKRDAVAVNPQWQKFFEGFDFALANYETNGEAGLSPKEFKVWNLIEAYRDKGHLISTTNPIRQRKDRGADLDLNNLGLTEQDLDQQFAAGEHVGLGKTSLRNIIDHLQRVYCENLGVEFQYIIDREEKKWFLKKMEIEGKNIALTIEKKKRILEKLNQTVVFEQFLNKKYIGQKRFSLEGGENTIPALDAIINQSAEQGVEEVVIGMAHRGRLNVLANLLGKTYENIFNEFEGNSVPDMTMGDGDVKYHLGYSSQVMTPTKKKVNLKLSPNPSHLEAVNPVLEGYVRAKSDILYDEDKSRILPLVIHGDAAVAGQGVVYEVLQMSKLAGYYTGGTIHFVINNQIGFTTDFDDARSAHYCTSLAAMVQSPVIHVNGDCSEDVIFAAELAAEYRSKFRKDIFVDMVCYRKHGHNEGDDPKYTQPALYNIINEHQNPREIYLKTLTERGDIEGELALKMDKEFWSELQDRFEMVKQKPLPYKYQEPELEWKKLKKKVDPKDILSPPKTSVPAKTVKSIFEKIYTLPKEFKVLRKVKKMLNTSSALFESGQVDWAMAELLAYGSLLAEGKDIRMSGQDIKRGTFSHRHAMLYEEESSKEYNRLANISEKQGQFRIYNSLLSEFGVLGFEYGYSMASPHSLNVWEAQFGDFANGAQTIIDQFITSGQSKWQRQSGITLLLPHGYEGQGPEHSSARLERFLQSCAEFNLIVANITSPANFFHILRRQLAWNFRKPLIVMSPKSLLRHPLCRSSVEELSKNNFQGLIGDDSIKDNKTVKRLLFCSGKIYFDLLEKKINEKRDDVAIVRIEQLYPLPMEEMDAEINKYPNAKIFWVQEEPANMGAWVYMLSCRQDLNWTLCARKSSASPATGFMKVHLEEQERILNEAFSK